MKAALSNYHARMQLVLDHIDRHLEDDLDLDAVSGVAAFSKYHFHRQFTATFGITAIKMSFASLAKAAVVAVSGRAASRAATEIC